MKTGGCPSSGPADCAFGGGTFDCGYDPGDNPFAYYKDLADDPAHFKDYSAFATDLTGGKLDAVTFVKALEYKTEHPGYGNTLSAGVTFVSTALQQIQASPYAASTLVLLTWDEGGGYFDHVAPPPTSPVDNQPYGTRVPLIAVGPFARAGAVSHVVDGALEHREVHRAELAREDRAARRARRDRREHRQPARSDPRRPGELTRPSVLASRAWMPSS